MKPHSRFVLLIAVVLAGCATPTPQARPPVPQAAAPAPIQAAGPRMLTMTTPRALHAAVALHDGRILICGGTATANIGGVLNSAEIYDPATGTFATTGAMTAARQGHTATLLPDGTVLIAGGSKNIGFRSELKSAEIYDPASGSFRATGSMKSPREGHSATLLRDGRVLIAGGSPNGIATTASVEVYDYHTRRFTALAPMGVPRSAHSATRLRSGRVLIAGGGRGGMPGGYIAYDTAEIFDPSTNRFHTLATHMTVDRVAPAAALLDDGRVLIAGGKSGKLRYHGASLSYFTPLETAEVFDPETSSFMKVGSMRAAHYLGVASLLNSGKVLITGGWTATGGVVGGITAAELFDPGSNAFSGGSDLRVGRLNQSSTLLPSGDVMVAGGLDRTARVTAAVEFYSARHDQFVLSPLSTNQPQVRE
jgi:hypothetical protein